MNDTRVRLTIHKKVTPADLPDRPSGRGHASAYANNVMAPLPKADWGTKAQLEGPVSAYVSDFLEGRVVRG